MSRGSIYTDRILTHDDDTEFSVHFYGHIFPVVVTSRESAVRRWISQLNGGFPPQRPDVLTTFSLLWPANALQHRDPPAIIQLCVGRQCLIFQIARAGYTIPAAIRDFFQDGRFVFYAWSNLTDHMRLRENFGVRVRNRGWVPQRVPLPVNTNRRLMIEEAVLRQLRCTVSFSENVYRSRWDIGELSIDQVQYAALEACLAYLVARTSRSSLFIWLF